MALLTCVKATGNIYLGVQGPRPHVLSAGARVQSLAGELDPTHHNQDPAQPNKYFFKIYLGTLSSYLLPTVFILSC